MVARLFQPSAKSGAFSTIVLKILSAVARSPSAMARLPTSNTLSTSDRPDLAQIAQICSSKPAAASGHGAACGFHRSAHRSWALWLRRDHVQPQCARPWPPDHAAMVGQRSDLFRRWHVIVLLRRGRYADRSRADADKRTDR